MASSSIPIAIVAASAFKGVTRNADGAASLPWTATYCGKFLGSYPTETAAAQAVDQEIALHHPHECKRNFPNGDSGFSFLDPLLPPRTGYGGQLNHWKELGWTTPKGTSPLFRLIVGLETYGEYWTHLCASIGRPDLTLDELQAECLQIDHIVPVSALSFAERTVAEGTTWTACVGLQFLNHHST